MEVVDLLVSEFETRTLDENVYVFRDVISVIFFFFRGGVVCFVRVIWVGG